MPGAGRDVRAIQSSAAMQDYRPHKSPKLTRRMARMNGIRQGVPGWLRQRREALDAACRWLRERGGDAARGPEEALRAWFMWLLAALGLSRGSGPAGFEGLPFSPRGAGAARGSGGKGAGRGPPAPGCGSGPTRRGFLKTGATALGVTALAASGVLAGAEKALAWQSHDLPPGFWDENLHDFIVQSCFYDMYKGHGLYRQPAVTIKRRLIRDFGIKGEQIKAETPFKEPAYWFTVLYYNHMFDNDGNIIDFIRDVGDTVKQVEKQNPAMYEWINGISGYFDKWVKNRYISPDDIEKYLTQSFVLCCGRPEYEYKELIRRVEDLQDDGYIKGIINSLKAQTYENRLLAAWDGYFLTMNRGLNDNKKDKNFYYSLEAPAARILGQPIRGPPHYGV